MEIHPLFRSPTQLQQLDKFFVEHRSNESVLKSLATGFRSEFEYPHPPAWGHVHNYLPLQSFTGSHRLREVFRKQVLEGRMIGGPGWTCQRVTSFFDDRQWYGIPCGAVEKDGDPLGRVVHDYGFFKRGSYSINAAHDNTRVRYDSIRKRVLVLRDICRYIKSDLESGFRQFGTHPFDWRFQIYCNGLDEDYIDIACPFGKTNSTLTFCLAVKLFVIPAAVRYREERGGYVPKLSPYVDDIYGGAPGSNCYETALELREFLCNRVHN